MRMYWSKDTHFQVLADNKSRDRYFSIRNNEKLRDGLTVSNEEKAEDKS